MYLFEVKRMEKTNRVSARKHGGDYNVCFLDNDRVYTVDEIIEKLHRAYEIGLTHGRLDKAEEIKKIFDIR